jgi:hypothetical protein
VKRLPWLPLSFLAISCGGVDAPASDAPPTPTIDASETPDSTTPAIDGAGSPDSAAVVDATPPAVDSAPGTVDAAPPIDADTACGAVGTTCSTSCPEGLYCYLSGAGGVCAPMRDGCGGFAGAMCMDPSAPICMYLTGADYGLCVSPAERDCICAGAPATVVDC